MCRTLVILVRKEALPYGRTQKLFFVRELCIEFVNAYAEHVVDLNDGVHAGLGSSPFDVAKLPDAELAELCGKLLADVFVFAGFSQPLSKCLSGCHNAHLLRTLYRRKQSAEKETDCTCSDKEQLCTVRCAELVLFVNRQKKAQRNQSSGPSLYFAFTGSKCPNCLFLHGGFDVLRFFRTLSEWIWFCPLFL